MPLYEHVFIARQDVSAQQVESLTEQFSNVITENGGKIAKGEYWGLKNLAYKVKKNRKGHMTLRVDAHEEGPSAMMQSRGDRRGGRSDRGERGDRGPREGGFRDRGPREDRNRDENKAESAE